MLFVMDAGASNSRDVKLLRSHLQELRAAVISVSSRTPLGNAVSSETCEKPTEVDNGSLFV